MTLKHFIDRPVLAAVISIVIVLGGIIGVATLPVEQYPDIAPPTVMVRASYPGASAETIQKSVIIPLEEAINGVENMMYIKSEASNAGSGSITVYFKQGTDADMAAVNVQNKVATATGSLPAEVTKIGVTTIHFLQKYLRQPIYYHGWHYNARNLFLPIGRQSLGGRFLIPPALSTLHHPYAN